MRLTEGIFSGRSRNGEAKAAQSWSKNGSMLMNTRSAGLAAVLLVCAFFLPVQEAAARVGAKAPAVVELYTAQGCAGCPDAAAGLKGVQARKDVLFLTFAVDYWDYLGWKDTFAKPEFTARQNAYKARFRLREIYTPQVVVDGRKETSGADHAKVEALADEHAPAGRRLHLVLKGQRLKVSGRAAPEGVQLWLIRYDPHAREVQVKSGENRGKTVVEQNLVRELVDLGRFKGAARSLTLPAPTEPGLATAVIAQGARGGPVLAVAR